MNFRIFSFVVVLLWEDWRIFRWKWSFAEEKRRKGNISSSFVFPSLRFLFPVKFSVFFLFFHVKKWKRMEIKKEKRKLFFSLISAKFHFLLVYCEDYDGSLCSWKWRNGRGKTEGNTLNIFAPERIKEKCENNYCHRKSFLASKGQKSLS